MKNKAKQYIPYEGYLKRTDDLNEMESQGIKLIFKKNWFKLISGVVLISAGVITLPLPTGSFILIGFGCYLLGLSTSDLFRYRKHIKEWLKYKFKRWFRK